MCGLDLQLGLVALLPFLVPRSCTGLVLGLDLQQQRLANQEPEQGPVHDLGTRKGSSASTSPAQHVNTNHKELHVHLKTRLATH